MVFAASTLFEQESIQLEYIFNPIRTGIFYSHFFTFAGLFVDIFYFNIINGCDIFNIPTNLNLKIQTND